MGQETEIAELLLTKFCHDMAGVIGAINNGIELQEEEDEELRRQAGELLKSSARGALVRLQFFRFIYGISDEDGKISLTEWKKLIANFYEGSKITAEYVSEPPDNCSREKAKLLANLIYAASAMLPRGGKLLIDVERMKIFSVSEHIRLEEPLQNALSGRETGLGEREIQPYYAALLAKKLGFSIDARKTPAGVEVKLAKIT